MRDYRIEPPHLQAMAKLLAWCDEASVVHWTQETADLPDRATAEKRMAESGRLSKVNHPSVDQQAGRLDFRTSDQQLLARVGKKLATSWDRLHRPVGLTRQAGRG